MQRSPVESCPIPPAEEPTLPFDTSVLDLTWTSPRAFTFENVRYSCVEEAYLAQTNIEGYELYVIAAIFMAQAEQHPEMANTLIQLRDMEIKETHHHDAFWIEHMPAILKSIGNDLHDRKES